MVSLLPWTLCPKTRQVRQVRSVSCQFWLAVLAVGSRGAMPEDAGSINLEIWDRRVWSKDRSTLAKINVQASTRNTVNVGNQEILSVAAFVSSNFQVKDTGLWSFAMPPKRAFVLPKPAERRRNPRTLFCHMLSLGDMSAWCKLQSWLSGIPFWPVRDPVCRQTMPNWAANS